MTMLYQPPTVTIDGKEYQVRRLNVRDVFRISRFISDGIKKMVEAGDNRELLMQNVTTENLLSLLGVVITYLEDETIALFADLIGVNKEEFAEMPMSAIVDIALALKEHEDLKAFFEKVSSLVANSTKNK